MMKLLLLKHVTTIRMMIVVLMMITIIELVTCKLIDPVIIHHTTASSADMSRFMQVYKPTTMPNQPGPQQASDGVGPYPGSTSYYTESSKGGTGAIGGFASPEWDSMGPPKTYNLWNRGIPVEADMRPDDHGSKAREPTEVGGIPVNFPSNVPGLNLNAQSPYPGGVPGGYAQTFGGPDGGGGVGVGGGAPQAPMLNGGGVPPPLPSASRVRSGYGIGNYGGSIPYLGGVADTWHYGGGPMGVALAHNEAPMIQDIPGAFVEEE